jgi:hypothetical protein
MSRLTGSIATREGMFDAWTDGIGSSVGNRVDIA